MAAPLLSKVAPMVELVTGTRMMMVLLAYPLVVGGQDSRGGNMCRFIKLLSPTDNIARSTGFHGQQKVKRILVDFG